MTRLMRNPILERLIRHAKPPMWINIYLRLLQINDFKYPTLTLCCILGDFRAIGNGIMYADALPVSYFSACNSKAKRF